MRDDDDGAGPHSVLTCARNFFKIMETIKVVLMVLMIIKITISKA